MKSKYNLLFYFIFMLSLAFLFFCYLNNSPLKSMLFFIFFFMLSCLSFSFQMKFWVSFFICMLFLSGILLILVYFSSFSKINFQPNSSVMPFMILLFFLSLFMSNNNFLSTMNSFYFEVFKPMLMLSLLALLLFLSFLSFFLNFIGSLRKF